MRIMPASLEHWHNYRKQKTKKQMAQAITTIERSLYKMDINSGGGNYLVADEPAEAGGQNTGFSPDELLCAALGACTAATLRMYADRKGWPLEKAEVKVHFERTASFTETQMVRSIQLHGPLTGEQRERLLEIAGKCPLHKTLTHPIHVQTTLQ